MDTRELESSIRAVKPRNATRNQINLVLDEKYMELLNFVLDRTDMTKSSIIRTGLLMIYNRLIELKTGEGEIITWQEIVYKNDGDQVGI